MAEIQARSQPPIFFCQVEDGDRRCQSDLGILWRQNWWERSWCLHGKQLQDRRDSCVRKAWKPSSSRPISIFFNLEAFTHYCHLHGPSLAQQINCHKILFSHIRRWCQFLFPNQISWFFVVLLFCVILLLLIFTKIMLLLSFYLINFSFFMKIIFIFSCSGMFRHVP